MYYRGDGVDINASKTALYLENAALNGDEKSQKIVGRIYMQLVQFDKAVPWLKKNAKEGDVEAAYFLGEIYCSQADYKSAKPWLDKAISSGYEKAKVLEATCKQ